MPRKRQPKIVVIGAASSGFSGLLADLVGAKELDGAEPALVDIDAEGLEIMTSLGRRGVKDWGKKTAVSGTPERAIPEGPEPGVRARLRAVGIANCGVTFNVRSGWARCEKWACEA